MTGRPRHQIARESRDQFCWFTGAPITKMGVTAPDAWSREHLIARSTELYSHLPKGSLKFNVVATFTVLNIRFGSLPFAIKYAVREKLWMELYGRRNANKVPVEERVPLTDELLERVFAVSDAEIASYRVGGKLVWLNPILPSGARYWSLDNPDMTEELLAERKSVWQPLRDAMSVRLKQKFGHRFKITEDIRHAIYHDLNEVPR